MKIKTMYYVAYREVGSLKPYHAKMDAQSLGYLLTDWAFVVIEIIKVTTVKRLFRKPVEIATKLDPAKERESIHQMVSTLKEIL